MFAALVIVLLGACDIADTVGAPLTITMSSDSILLSTSPNLLAADLRLERDLRLAGLTFPRDFAPMPGGAFAVLDALDRTVTVFTQDGERIRSFGREGDGPGEYEEPYGIAAFGDKLAIYDKNQRVTVLDHDGRVVGTHSNLRGDIQTMWQRQPTLEWEEPLQLSFEDATRRLSQIGADQFGLLIQDRDERFDTVFMSETVERRFPHNLIRFDSLARIVDTILTLEGQEITPREPFGDFYPQHGERPFARRPVWTSGDGWIAWGHGMDTLVHVRFDEADSLTIAWPADGRPLGDVEFNLYIDAELESFRRMDGEDFSDEDTPGARKEWIEKELDVGFDRPQLMGLLGDGPCLVLLGFRPDQGANFEATTVLILNVRDPARWSVVSIESEPGWVRSLQDEALFYIGIEEDGTRIVERYPVPAGVCSS